LSLPEFENPVHKERIPLPAAWTASEIGGKSGISRSLAPSEMEAMWESVECTRHRALHDLTRADFSHPLIHRRMDEVRRELIHGSGVVLLSGLAVDGRSLEEFGRLYWGLGRHLGLAAVNNRKGERLCRVQHETDRPVAGVGYLRNIELRAHSDYHEVLSLAAYQRAAQGGRTGLVSSLAVHNACLEENPDHLEALYEGYFQLAPGTARVLPRKAPLFCNVGGTVSLSFHLGLCEQAAALLGEGLPARLKAALDFVEEVAARPELQFSFLMEPGEILFWHNFTVLHSRTAFTDSEDRRRLLLRLWLHVPDGRAMHPTFNERARKHDQMYESAAAALLATT
jgi:hypothetical protein